MPCKLPASLLLIISFLIFDHSLFAASLSYNSPAKADIRFEQIDKNKDRKLSRKEIKKFEKKTGVKLVWLPNYDINRDGYITDVEYRDRDRDQYDRRQDLKLLIIEF